MSDNPGLDVLAPGRLVVANPLLPDPNFDRTVVMLLARSASMRANFSLVEEAAGHGVGPAREPVQVDVEQRQPARILRHQDEAR